MTKGNGQHKDETQKSQKYDNFIKALSVEVKKEQSLDVIENAMWSMRTLIVDNKQIPQQTRDNYEQLFRIAIPRLEQIINLIDKNL